MLIITPKELIETLKRYKEDEQLLVTWWSVEDVEMLMSDSGVEDMEQAQEIWDDVIFDVDSQASDHAISSVNDTLATLVYEKLEEK